MRVLLNKNLRATEERGRKREGEGERERTDRERITGAEWPTSGFLKQ